MASQDLQDGQGNLFASSQTFAGATILESSQNGASGDEQDAGVPTHPQAAGLSEIHEFPLVPTSWAGGANGTPETQKEPQADSQADVVELSDVTPAEAHAIAQYAKVHGLSQGQVQLSQVQASEEGILHYAMMGQDWGSRSNNSQCFQRAIRHRPGDKKIYMELDEKLRVEYRATWGLKRDFQFLGFLLAYLF